MSYFLRVDFVYRINYKFIASTSPEFSDCTVVGEG